MVAFNRNGLGVIPKTSLQNRYTTSVGLSRVTSSNQRNLSASLSQGAIDITRNDFSMSATKAILLKRNLMRTSKMLGRRQGPE